MKRRQILMASMGLAGSALARAVPAEASGLRWRERAMVGLGTSLHLRAAHHSDVQADVALDAAVQAIRRVESAMSLFRQDSELVQLNRQGFLDQPGPDLLTVLRVAQMVSRRSGGAFDVTVQPLWSLYAHAQRQGRLPHGRELAAVRQRIGWRQVVVKDARIELTRPGMALTLNGIAQGYAADVARDALRAHGVEHALIDAGEYACVGQNPQGRDWTLGVEDPREEARLLTALHTDGRSVATSADHRSAFTPDFRHHHILNPATGVSPPELSSVTVLAPSAMLADALTKVMFMAGPARIPRLADDWQVGVLWVDKSGRWQATRDIKLT